MLKHRSTKRPPTHPGEILLEEFLKPHGLSMVAAARRLGVSQQLLNKIVRGDGPVTVNTALRLERLFESEAAMWLNLQRDWDLWHALRQLKRELEFIRPLEGAVA